jgi:hypothetical protein
VASGLPVRDCVTVITEECVRYLRTDPPLVIDIVVVLFERPNFGEIATVACEVANKTTQPAP